MTAGEHRPPPPSGPLPGLETPFLDHEPPAAQRAESSPARLGELEAETAFAGAFDLPSARPGPGERERAEEPGGELVSPGAFELEETGIIDGDNRLRVKDTTGVPWRWICKIDIADSRGRPAGAGTGLLISNRHVLTAAHVVHDAYTNMQQYTITVIPALDDLEEPFGRYALASKPRIRQEYDPTAADSLDWDYALLTLGSAVGEQRFKTLNDRPLCFWGSPQCGENTMLARLDPRELNGKAAHTAGYPGGKGGRQLWRAAGLLHSADQQRRIMYTTADTTRGQSGSPVWVIDNKRHCLVGIAAGAGTGSNRIVRVTRELVRQLRAWITEGGETPAMAETEEALEPPVLLLPQPEAPPLDEQPVEQQFDPTAVPKDVTAEPWRALTETDNEFFALTGEDPDAALEFSGDPAGQESADVDEFEDPGELEEPDEFEGPAELEEPEEPEAELDDLPGQELEEPADVFAGENGADTDSRPPAASSEALTGAVRAATGVPDSQLEHQVALQRYETMLLGPYIKDLLARISTGRAERVLAFLTKWGRNASPFKIAETYLKLHWSGVKYWRKVAAAASRGTALLQHVEHLEAGARALKNAVDQQRHAWRQLPDYPLASDEKAGRMMVSPEELLYVERYYNTAMLIADDAAAAVAKLNEAIEGWDSVLRQADAANDFTRKSAWEAIIMLDKRIGGFRTYLVDVRDSAARIEASCRQSQYVAADILGKWTPPGFQPP